MKKIYYYVVLFFILGLTASFTIPRETKPNVLTKERARLLFETTPEESYKKIFPGNILKDSSYVKMAKEGWTVREIVRLSDEYLAAHKPELKKEGTNIDYAKFWRPYYVSRNLMDATILEYTDPQSLEKSKATVLATQEDPNAYYPRIFYTVNDRKNGIRNTGYFRHNAVIPAGGRVTWMAVNPDNADKMMVVPDGEGIWRSDDMGKHWDCITERIPNRYDRNESDAYSIPVDPDNWNQIFAFMANSTVYKTTDGGQTWTKVVGATHKNFKRGYCFRDGKGKLKFIGAVAGGSGNGTGNTLWISGDTCKTWRSIVLTDAQKDIDVNGTKTFWFQEIAFHPTGRDTLYAAGSRGILKSIDGGETWNRMTFNVYGATTATMRSATTNLFPLATANTPMFLVINPNKPSEIWAALSTRSNATYSALYKTSDGGRNWITLQEPSASIGSGGIFGNESAWNWLGGFAVNLTDQNYMFGCSMSSAESTNGGVNFNEYSWTTRHTGFYPDGNIYDMSCSGHNADNHFLISHKSGRVFRGGDAGLIVKDKNINNYKWTNIAGDMGEMMFYATATNEFGDMSIAGNTQDINGQFYQGGRWGCSRGYEGSTVWMNPYSSEPYVTSLGSTMTQLQNQDYGSWSKGWTKADVCTGNWYVRRESTNSDGSRFSIVKNFGKTAIGLDNSTVGFVQDFALSRDVVGGKLFIVRNNKLYYSTNSGTTFALINTGTFNPTRVAVNPDNSNEIYIAKNGAVSYTTNGGTSWQTISTSALSGVTICNFFYHEGSGDLYYVSAVHGIFIREANTTDWKLWSKGYNTAKLSDAQINYTTQEMLITDYGSGVWIADLQHPADRFLKNGFSLKQISNVNNTRTFGININYTIPLYYYFKWYVNGTLQANENGQYFSSSTLQPNDKVKLVVTLRESPDVSTTSADFTVASELTTNITNTRGNYLYSNQRGRVDLGYVDHFFGNFTLQMWVNPKTDGVILANRQVNTNGVKGFYLSITGGKIKFVYAPENNFQKPNNETSTATEFTIDGGAITMNTWNQITLTHNRTGNINLYVNGILTATQARALPAFTLNNSLYLSLFADGYEMNPIDGSVDELKIWNNVLDQTSIRQSMFGDIQPSSIKQIYYNDFNASTLATQKERYSQKGMAPRTDAQVEVKENPTSICATANEYKTVGTSWSAFANKGTTAMEIKSNDATFQPTISGLIYDNLAMTSTTNLPENYYTIYPTTFGVKMFDVSDLTKTVDVKMHLDPAVADIYNGSKLYTIDLTSNSDYWVASAATLTYNATDKTMSITGIKASDINNKRLAIVKAKAAIEYTSTAIGMERTLNVYTPDTMKVNFQATAVGGLMPPASYKVQADNQLVKSITPLSFSNNTATNTVSLLLPDNNMFDDKSTVNLTGENVNLIPYTFTTVNKITPALNAKGIKLNKGGGNVGSGSTYSALDGKNTATYMAWVRIDDATMLTGIKPILFFRDGGSKATGLILYDGKIGCHWNDESWSWNVDCGLKLTSADIGKWVHVAMAASPSGLTFYLNGKRGTVINHTVNGATIKSSMMIGKNLDSDANFIGAIDQISVWNRTLSAGEVVKYMHSRIYLNASGLISYIPFESELAGTGGYIDMKSGNLVSFNGVVTKNLTSNLPFNFVSQQSRTRNSNNGVVTDGISFTLPNTYPLSSAYFTSYFSGLPYNCIDTKYPKQVALENAFRTISFGTIRDFTSTERVQFTVENPNILDGDSVIFYSRSLGAETTFTTRYSVPAQAGKATFDVPGTLFNENLLYMFYRLPRMTTALPQTGVYHYQLSVADGVCKIANLRGNATVTFLDLNGRTVCTNHTYNPSYSVQLLKGAYVVKIDEAGITCMNKVVL